LLNQTYKDIEIILVDDGSKDSSGYLCEQFADLDKRVKTIRQANKGAAAARNNGIKAAQGKYISFVDAGDYVELNLYESLMQYVEAGIDLIDFPFYTQNSQNERFPCISKIDKNIVYNREFIDQEMMPCLLNIEDNPIINNPPICFSVKFLYKRDIIENNCILFDERRKKWEDKGFVLKYVDSSDNIVFYDKPLYTYLCLDTVDHLSSSYFRNLVFLIIEQREDYQKKYGSRYSFETDYYYANSISIVMGRIEEIVENETEEDAKELIKEIYSKRFVQKIAEWFFSDENTTSQYQSLIKHNDIDGTYLLMKQQIERKKTMSTQQSKSFIKRVKGRIKRVIRPLYYKIKAK